MNPIRKTTAVAVLAGFAASASAQTAYTWGAAGSGFWDDALNWSPSSGFPDLDGDTATLGIGGAYTVDLDRNVDVTSIDISNPDALLEIRSGNSASVYDRVTNDGAIVVNSNANVFNASLAFTLSDTAPVAGFTLDGVGRVVLGAVGDFPDAQVSADDVVLTHAASHTIEGVGQITGDVVNNGLITANVPASIGIRIQDTIDQSGGGTLAADGANIVLNTATVIGGDITTSAGGTLTLVNTPSVFTGNPQVSGSIAIPGSGVTLELASNITVDGDILINSTAQVFNSAIRFTDSVTLSGVADILMVTASSDTNDAKIEAAATFTGTLGPDIDIHGAGRLTGSLVLQGSLDADSPAELLEIFDTVTVAPGAIIRATGGELGLNSANIVNANLASSAGGRVRTTSALSLLDGPAVNSGTLAVLGGGHTIEANSSIQNDGVIQLNPDLTVFNSTLLLSGAPSISGSGQIQMSLASGDTNDAKIEAAVGITAVIGAGQIITGAGRFVGDFMSDARIEATSEIYPLELRGSVTQASGVIAADNAAFALVNASVTGGTFETSNAGVVTAASGADNAIADLTNTGDLGIDGTGSTLTASGAIVNNGRILINRTAQVFNATLALSHAASITGTGEINLASPSDFADARINVPAGSATIGPGQTLTGEGRTVGNLNILGTIAPGSGAGQIQCNSGTITLGATSTLEVELAAADGGSHDRIIGSADHVLAGDLMISEIDGYIPVVGDEFVLIDAASVTGKFDSATFPATLPNRVYRVFYESDRVLLVYTCDGDFAPPYDVLDFSDVLAFLTAFSTGDSLVDLAPPFGVFDFSDVIAFLTAFGAGCP